MKNKNIVWVFLLFFLFPVQIFAGDALHRLMHNDHDGLYVAELVEAGEEYLLFSVKESIVSTVSMRENWKPLPLTEFTLKRPEPDSKSIAWTQGNSEFFEEGGYYLVSLDKSIGGFEIAWGIYRVSSGDSSELELILPEDASDSERMDAVTIQSFVNAGGDMTEFDLERDGSLFSEQEQTGEEQGETPVQEEVQEEKEEPKKEDSVKNQREAMQRNRNSSMYLIPLLFLIWLSIRKKRKNRKEGEQ